MMQKRRLEITAHPTYQFSADGQKIFMRELPASDEKKRPITDFVIMLMHYGLSVTGWILAILLALNNWRGAG